MQSSQSTGRKVLKISLIILGIIIMLTGIFGIILYQQILDKKTEGFNETKKVILDQTSITQIIEIERYHGEQPYHIIYGKTENGEERIIFYPLKGKRKNITSIPEKDILSKEEIISLWSNHCNRCKLINITPGIINEHVVWELTYYDQNNLYYIDYMSINDGSVYEQYRLKKFFN